MAPTAKAKLDHALECMERARVNYENWRAKVALLKVEANREQKRAARQAEKMGWVDDHGVVFQKPPLRFFQWVAGCSVPFALDTREKEAATYAAMLAVLGMKYAPEQVRALDLWFWGATFKSIGAATPKRNGQKQRTGKVGIGVTAATRIVYGLMRAARNPQAVKRVLKERDRIIMQMRGLTP